MVAVDPLLGTEVFQIYPGMFASAVRHRSYVRSWQLAGEGFYHNIRRFRGDAAFFPLYYFHSTGNLRGQAQINFGIYFLKAGQVVCP
jgi:hypothetical protein